MMKILALAVVMIASANASSIVDIVDVPAGTTSVDLTKYSGCSGCSFIVLSDSQTGSGCIIVTEGYDNVVVKNLTPVNLSETSDTRGWGWLSFLWDFLFNTEPLNENEDQYLEEYYQNNGGTDEVTTNGDTGEVTTNGDTGEVTTN